MSEHKIKLLISNELGLHARAAAKLVKLANSFSCEININKNGNIANAKSIMGLLTLAAGKGSEIEIETSGDDADTAIEAITQLITQKFGES